MRKHYERNTRLGRSTTKTYRLLIAAALTGAIVFPGVFSCGGAGRRDAPKTVYILTSEQLTEIHQDIRFTYFYYPDTMLSGLMLNWQPDSILIQPRNADLPVKIPTLGLSKIEIVIGNRSMEGIAVGSLLAAGYFVAVKGYDLGTVTFGEGLAKLLVPPAIIVTAIGVGSSMEKRETYLLPPGFLYSYEQSKHPVRR